MSTVNGPIKAPYAANPSATPAVPPVTGTPASSIKTPAAQDYMKSISGTATPSPLGVGDVSKLFATAPVSPTVASPVAPPAPVEDEATSNYKSAFADYLKFLTPSDEESEASKKLADLQLQADKDQETALSRGETTGFATGEAARVNRENSFGITAASNALNALTAKRTGMTDALKARLDFTKSLLPEGQEGFTLGPDQVRYDAKGNKIAGGGAAGGGGAYVEGADPTVDAYVKAVRNNTTKLENVPAQYRDRVAQGVTSGASGQDPKAQYAKAQADEALVNIDNALKFIDNPEGMQGSESRILRSLPGSSLAFPSVANLNSALDTVRALVGFDALQKMRESSPTGGALGNITERELAFLQSVQGSLNTIQTNDQLKATLGRIQQSFRTLQLVNSPDGTVFELNGQQYEKRGNEMVPVGFNSVGGDTNQASNVPQRNKNPGNLKSGGLADSLAVGKDSQGHLIFPSVEVGFQALEQDLKAKLTGRSTKVKANPTIAELGKVYAEDPGWANKVAKILGVSPTTATTSVPFQQLLQAIARQEGFYA